MFDGIIKHLQYFQYVSHCHGTVERCATCQYKGNICGRAEYTRQEILGLAADAITVLQSKNAEKDKRIASVEAERDAAIADISHMCATCGRFEDGMCPVLRYKDYPKDCEHWKWRGAQEEA